MQKDFYDLVYVDGSHYYDNVIEDLRLAAPLVRDGGILCGDDLEAQLNEVDADFSRAKRGEDYVYDPKTGQGYHPGVTLACEEFFGGGISSAIGFFYVQKTGDTFASTSFTNKAIVMPEHLTPEMQTTCRALFAR